MCNYYSKGCTDVVWVNTLIVEYLAKRGFTDSCSVYYMQLLRVTDFFDTIIISEFFAIICSAQYSEAIYKQGDNLLTGRLQCMLMRINRSEIVLLFVSQNDGVLFSI